MDTRFSTDTDTQCLREVLLENPDVDILIHVDNDFAQAYDWSATCTIDFGVKVEELRLCEDDSWKDREEYKEYLEEDLELTDEEIEVKLNEAEFTKYIVIYVS